MNQDTISRQAAINIAKDLLIKMAEYHQYNQAINNYCAELMKLPSAQSEQPTGAQDILQYLDEYLHPIVSPEHWSVYSELYDMVSMLPSAEPERKKGKWERHNTYHGDDTSGFIDPDWRCSECGRQANVNEWFMYDLTDFCPHCGADMKGE